ncbi:hypothetical protein PFISCL1PPCAC_5409, partial [Pristionchus fissidentatus]
LQQLQQPSPPSSPSYHQLQHTTDGSNEMRRRSSSSSSSSHMDSSSPLRFSISGSIEGASRLEAGLEGVLQLGNKTHLCQLRSLHVQTSDPVLADIVTNMSSHMSTEFDTFAWPHLLTERAMQTLREISVLTLVVKITVEFVPERESILRRVSHRLKSVFSFFRRFR